MVVRIPYCEAVFPTLRAISPRLAIKIDFSGSTATVPDVVLFHLRFRAGDTVALDPRKARTRAMVDMSDHSRQLETLLIPANSLQDIAALFRKL